MKSGKLIYGLKDIKEIVHLLLNIMKTTPIFAFTGDLGVGKTTLIKMLLKEAGITDNITSPTFAYVNKYNNIQDQSFYHFDLYRMKSAHEFFDAGFDELLYRSNSWVFIEWPEIIIPHLKDRVCTISLEHYDEAKRLLKYSSS